MGLFYHKAVSAIIPLMKKYLLFGFAKTFLLSLIAGLVVRALFLHFASNAAYASFWLDFYGFYAISILSSFLLSLWAMVIPNITKNQGFQGVLFWVGVLGLFGVVGFTPSLKTSDTMVMLLVQASVIAIGKGWGDS